VIAHDPAQWHDFCLAVAGASGALLGLAFVAISINLEAILENDELPARALETLIFLAFPLASSLLIELPGISRVVLGIGLAILGGGFACIAIKDLPRWSGQPGEPLSWRLTQLVPAVLIAALASVGAIAVLTTSIGGLYWVAAAMAVATTSGLINSWVLLVEIKR